MPLKQLSTDHSKVNRSVNDMEVLKETDFFRRKQEKFEISMIGVTSSF